MLNKYEPLNLYTNFEKAAEKFPTKAIYFDEPLIAFPELNLETTYLGCKESIVNRAAQLHQLGVKKADKMS